MDSSNRVQLLTEGLYVNPGDLSSEERVKVMRYWIEAYRVYFRYLPIFQPLRGRIDSSPEPNRTRGPVSDNVVALLGSGVDGRLKVARVKCVSYSAKAGVIEFKTTILLDEKGRFLLEQVKVEVSSEHEEMGSRYETLRDYTGCLLDDAEVLQWEGVDSFFQETFSTIVNSFRQVGQEKVDWGNMFLHMADKIESRLGTAVRW